MLEGKLGHGVWAFAYPFGSALDYSNLTCGLVREAGFAYAVSNRYGRNDSGADSFALRRIWVDRTDTMDDFKAKVTGRLDYLSVVDSGVGIRARRLANRLLGVRVAHGVVNGLKFV